MILRRLKKISNILIKEMMKLRPQWIFKCVLYKILRFSRIYHRAIMLFLTITMTKIICQPAPYTSPDSPLNQINCEYLNTFDFVKNVKPKLMEEPKLNVICFNIRSIRDEWANFKDLILINGYCPFDVIGITDRGFQKLMIIMNFPFLAFKLFILKEN